MKPEKLAIYMGNLEFIIGESSRENKSSEKCKINALSLNILAVMKFACTLNCYNAYQHGVILCHKSETNFKK